MAQTSACLLLLPLLAVAAVASGTARADRRDGLAARRSGGGLAVAGKSGLAQQRALEASWAEELEPSTKQVEYKSPVQRVVKLLEEMQAQLGAEAGKESEMWEQQSCWCETNEKEKTKAIEDADVKTTDLQSEIESRSARHGVLSTDIAALKENIATEEDAVKTMMAIREKEAASFNDEEKDMMNAVTNLKNAIAVLSRHQKADASLLQLDLPELASVRAVLRDVSLKYDLMLGDTPRGQMRSGHRGTAALLAVGSQQSGREGLDKVLLRALDSGSGSSDVLPLNLAERMLSQIARAPTTGAFVQSAEEQPNQYESYSSRSSSIFGVLSQMKDEFEANLSQAQKDELKARSDYEELYQSKTAAIAVAKEKLDGLQGEHADNNMALSNTKEDFELTRKQRTADVEFLSNLRLKCQALDKDWQERSATRSEEMKAVAEALAILKDDDARELTAKTVSLLQVASHADSVADAEVRVRRSRAAAALRHAAREPDFEVGDLLTAWHSRTSSALGASGGPKTQLATLAVSVELDGFTQVKEAMDKMVADLKEQQENEVNSKAHCVKELDTNEKATYKTSELKGDLESKLAMLATTIKELEGGIASAGEQITETKSAIKKASESREKDNAEFQTVVADQRATQAILKKALARLELFYKKKASKPALLQRVVRVVQAQTPPVQFDKYRKNSGSSTVMGLLEQIVEDSKKLEGEALAGEQESQADYESFVKDSNAVIGELEEAVTMKTKAVASAKMDSEETGSEHQSAVGELESLAEYKADLHGQCDFLLKNFEIRQKARLQEIEAIGQAKAILSGAATAA